MALNGPSGRLKNKPATVMTRFRETTASDTQSTTHKAPSINSAGRPRSDGPNVIGSGGFSVFAFGPTSIFRLPMASITSNSGEVVRSLSGLAHALNLRGRVAGGKTLGAALVDTASVAIEARSVERQTDPAGTPWAKLRPRTVERKARLGLDPRVNVETGSMLSLQEIRGTVTVTPDSASMTAGLDAFTQDKVDWAQSGGPNRPARPFMDLGPDGEAAVDGLVDGVIGDAVRKAGG